MHIDIHLPRPGLTLLFLAAVSGWSVVLLESDGEVTMPKTTAQALEQFAATSPMAASVLDSDASGDTAQAVGGDDTSAVWTVSDTERRAMQARAQQQLLREKQEVITELLRGLEAERQNTSDADAQLESQFRDASAMLASLLKDEKKAEQFILTTYKQIWEAEDRAVALGKSVRGDTSSIALEWPVEPLLGISAEFLSPEYRHRFHFDHYGVDIPVDQGSDVHAAAGGIVRDAVDHGLGFSYITVEHPGGYVTLYGHLSGFSVQPGDHVIVGDVIGKSGGRPGTRGAGFSTGPHLHFGLYVNGAAVDPMTYLSRE